MQNDATERDSVCQLRAICSGGSSGADRGGLMAAERLGLCTYGWAPAKFWVEGDIKKDLKHRYGLRETPMQGGNMIQSVIRRSMLNVDDSDATVAFFLRYSPGTSKTLGYCVSKKWENYNERQKVIMPYRPFLVIRHMNRSEQEELRSFLLRHKVRRLNVAGHRGDSDFTRSVCEFLVEALGESGFLAAKHEGT